MQWPHTVTLFCAHGGRIVLEGVLLETTKGTKAAKGELNSTDPATIFIPMQYAPDLQLTAEKDFFCRGVVNEDDRSYQEIREMHETYRVTSVARYDYGGLQHWEVTGR